MNDTDLRAAYERLVAKLKKLRGASDVAEHFAFDGTAADLERFAYFDYDQTAGLFHCVEVAKERIAKEESRVARPGKLT